MRVTWIRDTCPVSVKTSGKGNNLDIIIMHDINNYTKKNQFCTKNYVNYNITCTLFFLCVTVTGRKRTLFRL